MASDADKQYYANMFSHRGFKNIEIQKSGEIDIMMEGSRESIVIKCGINCSHTNETVTRDMVHAFYTAMLSVRYSGEKVGYIISRVGFTQKAIDHGKEINRAQTSLKFIFVTEDIIEKYENEIEEAKQKEIDTERRATIQDVVDEYEVKLDTLKQQIEAERKQLAANQAQIEAERKALADKVVAIDQDEARRMENFNRRINKLYHESLGKHFIAVLKDDLGFARLLSSIHPGRFKAVFYIELLLTILIFGLIAYLMIENGIPSIW